MHQSASATPPATPATGVSSHPSPDSSAAPTDWRYTAGLSLAALGVVYGDIGTSPLYALRESFLPEHGVAVSPANVLGVLSMIFWALILVISIKYLVLILRADNRGEGGILALTALITPTHLTKRRRSGLIAIGLFGTALLYGDGMITPAISVLSAVEGLGEVTPAFGPYILPITVVILTMLFLVQRGGTARVGRVFGPLTMVWFVTLAALGLWHIVQSPDVLRAASPWYAVRFVMQNGWHALMVLGSVFLVVTGGEALYADMGHFGRRPIRLAWFVVVLPSLLLNYFGQGALVMRDPSAISNPFYRMAPEWALVPVVLIATVATVIASQALISGAFSLTLQAVQLGYSPRVRIDHTSAREPGQIYVAAVNWALMVSCIGLVLGFRTSSALAAAYGVAVTMTMTITTLLFYVVARERWGWSLGAAVGVTGFFLLIDFTFLSANLVKIPHGGWFPLVIGLVVFTALTTWKRGRAVLQQRLHAHAPDRAVLLESLLRSPPHRVPGTAVFMYGSVSHVPPALLHNLKHNKVLHERVVFLCVRTEEVPWVPAGERARVTPLVGGVWQVELRYGFMEDVDLPLALERLGDSRLVIEPMAATFYLGRESLVVRRLPELSRWRAHLFRLLSRNAQSATAYFRLPPNRVVELGTQVEI